jgi:hypothetical protein
MRHLQLTQLPPFGVSAVSNRQAVRLMLETQSGEQIGADLSADAAAALRMQLSVALDAIEADAPNPAATPKPRGKRK